MESVSFTFKVVNNAVVADQSYQNPASVRGGYTQAATRYGNTRIDSFDARASGDVIDLWSGPVGVSFGTEWRRDFKLDRKLPFIGRNPADSGLDPNDNDIVVMSPREVFRASRTIASAYAETAIPLVARKNNVPLVRSFDLSASARFERYSDFGNTTKPKFGLTWRPSGESCSAPRATRALSRRTSRAFTHRRSSPVRVRPASSTRCAVISSPVPAARPTRAC